jgi:hypothetical protein
MYNMVMNLSMVFSQTIVVKLLMPFSYQVKFLIALIPLIIMMVVFPVMTEFPDDNAAWALSNIGCAIIGKLMIN